MTAVRPATVLRSHLAEVDVLRILTFACVIAVHVIGATVDPHDVPMYGVLGLVHFTREVFFALTAFVLVYSYERRPRPMRRFLPRRFLLVGVPYVVWTAIYQAYADAQHPSQSLLVDLENFLLSLVEGTGEYHLYFLLVTMQVYLLLPVVLWLVRRTRGHHGVLLGVALVAQLLVLGLWEYVPHADGVVPNLDNATFPSYTFMILAGAVAADHAEGFLTGIRTRRRAIVAGVVAGAVLLVAVFLVNDEVLGLSYSKAVDALQPVMAVWATVVGLGFLAIGARWADRRDPSSRLARAVDTGSDISFGVFLVHPLVLSVLQMVGGAALAAVPDPWLELIAYVVVVVVSLAFAWLARRTPLSMPLTGRPRRRTTPAAPTPPPA